MFFVQSCKKSPTGGEAFLTTNSGDVIPIADTEVMFYDDDFIQDCKAFRSSFFADTNKEVSMLIQKGIDVEKDVLSALIKDGEPNNELIEASRTKIEEFQEHATLMSSWKTPFPNFDAKEGLPVLEKLATYPRKLRQLWFAIAQANIEKFLRSKKISSSRTGSDGKFTVPPKARYLAAIHNRPEPAQECVFWLIRINLEDENIKLTNSNVTASGRNPEPYGDEILDSMYIDTTLFMGLVAAELE
jgi:hypothetical protein